MFTLARILSAHVGLSWQIARSFTFIFFILVIPFSYRQLFGGLGGPFGGNLSHFGPWLLRTPWQYKLYILTLAGHLLATFVPEQDPALGIRNVVWHPSGSFLAVAGYDDKVHSYDVNILWIPQVADPCPRFSQLGSGEDPWASLTNTFRHSTYHLFETYHHFHCYLGSIASLAGTIQLARFSAWLCFPAMSVWSHPMKTWGSFQCRWLCAECSLRTLDPYKSRKTWSEERSSSIRMESGWYTVDGAFWYEYSYCAV